MSSTALRQGFFAPQEFTARPCHARVSAQVDGMETVSPLLSLVLCKELHEDPSIVGPC